MSLAVDFNYSAWTARFPEFAAVPDELAAQYFAEATIYWRNDGTSPASTTAIQSVILNLLTAHIASLYVQSQGMPAPGQPQDANTPVGPVTTATQGSVTVTTTPMLAPGTDGLQAWLAQTKYGLQAWSMMSQYKTFRYVQGALQPGGLGSMLYNRWPVY